MIDMLNQLTKVLEKINNDTHKKIVSSLKIRRTHDTICCIKFSKVKLGRILRHSLQHTFDIKESMPLFAWTLYIHLGDAVSHSKNIQVVLELLKNRYAKHLDTLKLTQKVQYLKKQKGQ